MLSFDFRLFLLKFLQNRRLFLRLLFLFAVSVVNDPVNHTIVIFQKLLNLLQRVVCEELRNLPESKGIYLECLILTVLVKNNNIAHTQRVASKISRMTQVEALIDTVQRLARR